jgi:DNA-binding SARP family transcriptional activator
MDAHYQIELLGGLRVQRDDRLITRFRRRKTAALMAYLAYYSERTHSRDLWIELLWPECDVEPVSVLAE